MNRMLVLSLILVAVVGCSNSDETAGFSGDAEIAFSRTGEQRVGEFLAYEHTLVVDTNEDKLADSFKSITDACTADRENQCTVLHSEINHGSYNRASIRMRVKRGFLRAYYPTPRTMVFRRSDILKYLESTTANIKSSLSGKEA